MYIITYYYYYVCVRMFFQETWQISYRSETSF